MVRRCAGGHCFAHRHCVTELWPASRHARMGTMSTPGVEHPVAGVIVPPSLTCLAADRRLLFAPTGQRVYRARPHRSTSDVLVALLLLLGGVELNEHISIADDHRPLDTTRRPVPWHAQRPLSLTSLVRHTAATRWT